MSAAPAIAAGTPVTLAEVLGAPADKQLSYTFAQQQVRAGRLDQAAVALKQVLQIAPEWDSARLFYGIVLFRLGDMSSAETELKAVAVRKLTQEQQQEVARYLALIEARTGQVHEAAFLPPPAAQAGIASLLALGTEQPGSRKNAQQARIAAAFASTEIAVADRDLAGGHGSFLLFGEAGDPAGIASENDPEAYAAAGAASSVMSLGKVRITAEVLQAAFSPDFDILTRTSRIPNGPMLNSAAAATVTASTPETSASVGTEGGSFGVGQYMLGDVWYQELPADSAVNTDSRFTPVQDRKVEVDTGLGAVVAAPAPKAAAAKTTKATRKVGPPLDLTAAAAKPSAF